LDGVAATEQYHWKPLETNTDDENTRALEVPEWLREEDGLIDSMDALRDLKLQVGLLPTTTDLPGH